MSAPEALGGPGRNHTSGRAMRRLLWVYARHHWMLFLAAVLAALVKAFAPLAVIWVIGRIVDTMTALGRNEVTPQDARSQVLYYAMIGALAFLVSIPPTYWRNALPGLAVRRIQHDIGRSLYSQLLRMSESFHDAHRSGVLASRIADDVAAVAPFISSTCVQMPMATIVFVVVLGYFLSLNVVLAVVAVCLLPIQWLAARAVANRTQAESRIMLVRRGKLASILQEKLAATATVKAFGQERREVARAVQEATYLSTVGVRLSRLGGLSQVVSQSLDMLSPLSLAVAGGLLAAMPGSSISIGLLLQFILMHARVLQPLTWMLQLQTVSATARAAAERIFEVLDAEPAIRDRPEALATPPAHGDVSFENVTFGYHGATKPVFQGLNLDVKHGSKVALVGPSGSGKTTLATLLLRLYDVNAGRISIDGIDIRDYSVAALRRAIGLVQQDSVLFSGSVYENILYARPDATAADVERAARRAQAHEFIDQLDSGYGEVLGERGTKLSGGQCQRIAIARIFLKDPRIIVLDEATSALDTISEKLVGRALEELAVGRTTIVIAHRLSTVRTADDIVVLDHGVIVERGNHDRLIAADGMYARLYGQGIATWMDDALEDPASPGADPTRSATLGT